MIGEDKWIFGEGRIDRSWLIRFVNSSPFGENCNAENEINIYEEKGLNLLMFLLFVSRERKRK